MNKAGTIFVYRERSPQKHRWVEISGLLISHGMLNPRRLRIWKVFFVCKLPTRFYSHHAAQGRPWKGGQSLWGEGTAPVTKSRLVQKWNKVYFWSCKPIFVKNLLFYLSISFYIIIYNFSFIYLSCNSGNSNSIVILSDFPNEQRNSQLI